ncbi:MAG: M20/M25/M40 family metallo-hydrolase [Acidobacteriota bacterium]
MPTTTLSEETALLAQLVALPSVSGEEQIVAAALQRAATALGLKVWCNDNGVFIEVAGRSSGPTLAFLSHIDTVPPGDGWSRNPFGAEVDDGRLFGRGSSDAKASVAAMLYAAHDLQRSGLPSRGRLLAIFGFNEETKATSMPAAVAECGRLDAAVIGEPTSLSLACAQRGLVVAEITASGTQRHAAHSSTDDDNSILRLARDLLCAETLFAEREHALLGRVSVTPTMISGGVARNLTAPAAHAVLDIRTTPDWTHDEIESLLRSTLKADVVIASKRLLPCETPRESSLLALAQQLRPEARRYGSPTCSDWVFVRHLDAFKCGPGDSALSHRPDESVDLLQVREARKFYAALAAGYLS